MKSLKGVIILLILWLASSSLPAADYVIDPAHSFVTFRIKHLGYSWLHGQFRQISGQFSYDSDTPSKSHILVRIDAKSLDTNHAERDKHLKSADFFDVESFGDIVFESTRYTGTDSEGVIEGNLTLLGTTRTIEIKVRKIGEGNDPWSGYRAGFHGTYILNRSDFGMTYNLGKSSELVKIELSIEGIRQ